MEDIIETTEEGVVRIIFEKSQDQLTYRDALYYSQEDYGNIDQATIEAEKDRRFANWLAIVSPPQPEVTTADPTV